MSGLKIADVIKPFDGDGDIESWLLKFEMIVKAQKLKEEKMLLPMFLEKEALAVFLELGDEEKNCAEKIKDKLRRVFGENPYFAFKKLCDKKWMGEPIDVFVSDLRRLARCAGINGETIIKRAFVNGLPENFSREIRGMGNSENCGLEEILCKARAMSSSMKQENLVASATYRSEMKSEFMNRRNIIECYSCGGPHLQRFCKSFIRCFSCGGKGHISRDCNCRGSGNGLKGDVAPETTSKAHGPVSH